MQGVENIEAPLGDLAALADPPIVMPQQENGHKPARPGEREPIDGEIWSAAILHFEKGVEGHGDKLHQQEQEVREPLVLIIAIKIIEGEHHEHPGIAPIPKGGEQEDDSQKEYLQAGALHLVPDPQREKP